jgi:hypothetical protein
MKPRIINFLQLSIVSSLLGPDIILSTLFSNTCAVLISLIVRGKLVVYEACLL